MQQQKRIKRHLMTFISLETILYGVGVGASESFAFYFAVKHGVGGFELGLLTTLPMLIGSLFQWRIPRLIKDTNLKWALLLFSIIQALGILQLYFHERYDFSFEGFLAGLTLYWIGGLTLLPLWVDWIARYFSPEQTREVVSKRNKQLFFVTLFTFVGLSWCMQQELILRADYIFLIAFGARVFSFLMQLFINFHYKESDKDYIFIYKSFLKDEQSEKINFEDWKSVLYLTLGITALFRFFVSFSAPFFPEYMIKDLKFTHMEYVLMTAAPFLGRALFMSTWGMNFKGLRPFWALMICSLVLAINPLVWVISDSLWLLMSFEVFNGVFWAGFELASIFVIQNMLGQNSRQLLGAHMAVSNTLATLGAMVGAYLQKQGLTVKDLFVVSTVFRATCFVMFFFAFKKYSELRFSARNYGTYLLSVLSFRPTLSDVGKMTMPRPDYMAQEIPLEENSSILETLSITSKDDD